jgi:hypothetical protein
MLNKLSEERAMILNIRDHRTRPYRWKHVNAIVEPTWHDNSCTNSDQADESEDDVEYDVHENISLSQAVIWAESFKSPVTLYLYDLGHGTNTAKSKSSTTERKKKSSFFNFINRLVGRFVR